MFFKSFFGQRTIYSSQLSQGNTMCTSDEMDLGGEFLELLSPGLGRLL